MKIMISILLVICISNYSGVGQTHSKRDLTMFLKTQLKSYREWIIECKLSKILYVDTVILSKGKHKLEMSLTALSDWDNLDNLLDSNYGRTIDDLLMRQFTFRFDIYNDSVEIVIDAPDAKIFLTQNNYQVNKDIWKKMGETPNPISIEELNTIEIDELKTQRNTRLPINEAQERIKKGLLPFFKNYKPALEKISYKIIFQDENTLMFEVSNIVSAVLDEGYFEHLRVTYKFKLNENNTTIFQYIYGKYGPGILWAPSNSRYKNMSPTYDEELKRFQLLVSTKIGELLK